MNNMIWFLAIEVWNSDMNGIYAGFYGSPNKSIVIENALNSFDQFLEMSINLNKLNVITGDLNIDLSSANEYSKMAMDMLEKHELKLCGNFVIRENNISGTIIDLIASNGQNLSCFPLNNEIISDHKTIMVRMLKTNDPKPVKNNIVSWKQYSKDGLLMNLRKCDWSNFYNAPLNEKVHIIRNNIMNSVCPFTKIIQVKNTIKPKPWFNKETKQLKWEKENSYMNWAEK